MEKSKILVETGWVLYRGLTHKDAIKKCAEIDELFDKIDPEGKFYGGGHSYKRSLTLCAMEILTTVFLSTTQKNVQSE